MTAGAPGGAPGRDRWDWDELLTDALRAGVGVSEFWDLTPREVQFVFESDGWRQRRERQRDAWLAWHIAGMMRTKRMPSLNVLIPPEPRAVMGDELERRRRDHERIVRRLGRGR